MTSVTNRRGPGSHVRRPLRVSPAWVGAARPTADNVTHHAGVLPVRDAVWVWSVRRFARISLWALPLAAVAHGWATLGVPTGPGELAVHLVAAWLSLVAMVAITALLAGSQGRRPAVAGLLLGLAGTVLLLPLAALPAGTVPAGTPLLPGQVTVAAAAATLAAAVGWFLLGWAVYRSRMLNPADGVLLMLAAASTAAGAFAVDPLPTVGALLLLAAGMGIAWTGGRFIPAA